MRASEISKLLNAEVVGDSNAEVFTVDELRGLKANALSFVGDDSYLKHVSSARSSILLVEDNIAREELNVWVGASKVGGRAYIPVKHAYVNFLKLVNKIVPKADLKPYLRDSKDEKPFIYPGAYVSDNAKIGKRTVVCPGVAIMGNATVGDDVVLYPNVSVYNNSTIGDRVIIGAGSVVGSDGFGFVKDADGTLLKVPHLGGVIIEDDVEIGSNTSVDRGTLGNTIIKKGTKIDNLVQIAHNCIVGENNIICGLTGLSGSTELGNNVIMGAGSGTKGHIKIGDNCIVTARTSVSKDLKPGSEVKGMYPARPLAEELKIQTLVGKLPELYNRIKKLEKGDK